MSDKGQDILRAGRTHTRTDRMSSEKAEQHLSLSSSWELASKRERDGDLAGAFSCLEHVVSGLDDDVLGKNKWKIFGRLADLGERSNVEYGKVLRYATKQLDAAKELGDVDGQRSAFMVLGRIKRKGDDASGAREAFLEAASIATAPKSRALAFYNAAEVMNEHGDPASPETYAKARDAFSEASDMKGVYVCYEKQISLYSKLGDNHRAMEVSIAFVGELLQDETSDVSTRTSSSHMCAILCFKCEDFRTCVHYATAVSDICDGNPECAAKTHIASIHLQLQALRALFAKNQELQTDETTREQYLGALKRLTHARKRYGEKTADEIAKELASYAGVQNAELSSVAYNLASEQGESVSVRLGLKQTAAAKVYSRGNAHAAIRLLEPLLDEIRRASKEVQFETLTSVEGSGCTCLLIDALIKVEKLEEALQHCDFLASVAKSALDGDCGGGDREVMIRKIEAQAIDRKLFVVKVCDSLCLYVCGHNYKTCACPRHRRGENVLTRLLFFCFVLVRVWCVHPPSPRSPALCCLLYAVIPLLYARDRHAASQHRSSFLLWSTRWKSRVPRMRPQIH